MYISQISIALQDWLLIILIDCEIALKKVPVTPGSEAVSIVACESE